MIEKNEPIDFVGEVTILAEMEKTSVTIETLTETTVVYFSRKDFEDWISQDIQLLRLVAHKIAYKLYPLLLQPRRAAFLSADLSAARLCLKASGADGH